MPSGFLTCQGSPAVQAAVGACGGKDVCSFSRVRAGRKRFAMINQAGRSMSVSYVGNVWF